MDKRALKSKNAIIATFLALIKKDPEERITVKELCEKAHINKSTFYALPGPARSARTARRPADRSDPVDAASFRHVFDRPARTVCIGSVSGPDPVRARNGSAFPGQLESPVRRQARKGHPAGRRFEISVIFLYAAGRYPAHLPDPGSVPYVSELQRRRRRAHPHHYRYFESFDQIILKGGCALRHAKNGSFDPLFTNTYSSRRK